MPNRLPVCRFASTALVLAMAACATPGPAPPPPARKIAVAAPHPRPAPLDWFHRQLAAAHRAKITHLPAGDTAGAQRAYYAVMLPVCGQVAKAGPAKYRARCQALVAHATDAAAAAADTPPCDADHDDSADTQAQITACSD